MWLLRLNREIIRNKYAVRERCFYSTNTKYVDNEYTDTPQYPEILDLSYKKVVERRKDAEANEIKIVKTVEEKQIKLNMPKYYGFPCYMLNENHIPYNSLPLTQYLTRTHFIQQDWLPDYYKDIAVDDLAHKIKPLIEEILVLEYDGYKKMYELADTKLSKSQTEDLLSTSITKQINRLLLNNLCSQASHLIHTQTDFNPRIESFWIAGGVEPPKSVKKSRKNLTWMKDMIEDPVDRYIQYIGDPNLTLRSELPLRPIISYEEAQSSNFDVPNFQFDPRVSGSYVEHRRAVNIPGFWPGDTYRFGLISFHKRGHLSTRPFNDAEGDKDALHRLGILAGFGWLNAQANFLGFTTYNDITYPLVTQCVVTNGQYWSFYVYQLNTVLMYLNHWQTNPKTNICWGTTDMKLFEKVKDGKVEGFNEDVLKFLIKFYVNTPQTREALELQPYLNADEKVIGDYKDDEKRQWLEREYKFITSNRPRHYLPYELYHWEKIYKVDHKTRPMDPRRRPFELFINPFRRKYNERLPRYIPRKLRPDLPRHKGRYANEYFP